MLKQIFRYGYVLTFLTVLLVCGRTRSSSDSNDWDFTDPDSLPSELLLPQDFNYLGAFRMPEGSSDIQSFNYGGLAMTYYPEGDPGGADDGYPGSLYVAGHCWQYQISEISIPEPIISQYKNPEELNSAQILQPFRDILDVADLEIPRAGIAYLPRQGGQTSDKLHFCWGFHMQQDEPSLTHGWCELNLALPQIKKGWYLKGLAVHLRNLSTNEYLFAIPPAWANRYTQGKTLATGRFRDGGWSGQGPALFAIAPWDHGNPPASGTGIDQVTLLLYSSTMDPDSENHRMTNYHHSDEWSGGAWLTSDNKAALIFLGTKGTGQCWYGNPDGPCEDCENRGWWSSGFKGQIIFYNPTDLAAVAEGQKKAYDPQPYAALDIDSHLFHVKSGQQKHHVGAATYDRRNRILYISEFQADNDRCLIHAFQIDQK